MNSISKTYIIAELSANHQNDLDIAKRSVQAMKQAGADAVKIQTFKPESITLDSDQPWFQTRKDTIWAGQKLFDLYRKAALPYEWHRELQKVAYDEGLEFFSAPFDFEGVDFLESLNVPIYKIASLEISDIPLIRKVAQTGKPMIISTGVASWEDVELAVQTCIDEGNHAFSLLKCTSAYPTPYNEVNLNSMLMLKELNPLSIGVSDHTLGIEVPILSVALGGQIIEKHFILDKSGSSSVDKDFSLDKDEFKKMVDAVRRAEDILGEKDWKLSEKQLKAKTSQRSLFAVKDIQANEAFSNDNIRSLRPAKGLHPKKLNNLIGKKAKSFIERGTPLDEDMYF
jgi:pseudaminic acid synthase